jgi:tetratricopeptide (TPR) repeat protein
MKRNTLFVAGILIIYACLFHPDPGWNVASRLGLVYSVVDHGSLSIDAYHEATGDKAFYRGHFYSDKAIGHALPGIPLYALARLILTPLGLAPGSTVFHYLLKTMLVSLPSALACLILLRLVRRHVSDERWARGLVAAYALGTLALPYSVVYYSHQQVAVALLASFSLAGGRARWSRSFEVGLLIGYAFLLEYPTVLAGAIIALYHLLENRRAGSAVALVAGVAPTVALFALYNWACFDSPLTTGYSHKYLPYLAHVHDAGFMGIARPSLRKLVAILFAPKGLVSTSPFLVLALPGLLRAGRDRALWAAALVAAVLILFNASLIWEPFGGWTPGPRYSVPAIPFLVLLCAPALSRHGWAGPLLVGGGLTGLLYHGLAAVVNVHVPEEVGTPLTQYLVPLARVGCVEGSTVPSLVAAAAGIAATAGSILGLPTREGTRRPRTGRVQWCFAGMVLLGCWALLVRPVNPGWGHYHLGSALLECGKGDQAEHELLRSVQLAPALQPAHTKLGLICAARGDTAAALIHLEKALALRASDETARQTLRSLTSPAAAKTGETKHGD